MDEFVKYLEYLMRRFDVPSLATFASFVATLLGFLASAAGVRSWRDGIKPPTTSSAVPSAIDGVTERLQETKQALKQQYTLARAHRIGGGLLTFGQFIVGGLLASSFVLEQTSKSLIGMLGLLVLASSIIRQHYRPETSSVAARERAVRLKAVIREVEDQVYFGTHSVDHATAPQELRRLLTQALNDFDTTEARDFAKSVMTPTRSRKSNSDSGA
jgi:hypothetical protein